MRQTCTDAIDVERGDLHSQIGERTIIGERREASRLNNPGDSTKGKQTKCEREETTNGTAKLFDLHLCADDESNFLIGIRPFVGTRPSGGVNFPAPFMIVDDEAVSGKKVDIQRQLR